MSCLSVLESEVFYFELQIASVNLLRETYLIKQTAFIGCLLQGANHRRRLTLMEPRIARLCNLYYQLDATYKMFFIIISDLRVTGGIFRPSSGAYKTVCAALVMPCFPAGYRWCGWVGTLSV
jgi:hypothetical protein